MPPRHALLWQALAARASRYDAAHDHAGRLGVSRCSRPAKAERHRADSHRRHRRPRSTPTPSSRGMHGSEFRRCSGCARIKLVRATHAVITNAREDHLGVKLGPGGLGVALGPGGHGAGGRQTLHGRAGLSRCLPKKVCRDRKCELIAVTPAGKSLPITPLDLAGFSYVEHAENIALAAQGCWPCGGGGAWRGACRGCGGPIPIRAPCRPMKVTNFFGRGDQLRQRLRGQRSCSRLSEYLAMAAVELSAGVEKRIAVFNCRADRPDRFAAARDGRRPMATGR